MVVRVLVINLLSVLLGAAHLSAQTMLNSKWKEGDRFSYEIEEKFSMTADPAASSYKYSLKLDTKWHVRNVGQDGNAVITVEIERVRFKMDSKGIPLPDEINVDTQNPPEAQSKVDSITLGAVNGFVGPQMEITINEKREIATIELSEPLVAHFERNPIMRELAFVHGPAFRKSGMQRRITNWLIASPPNPVSKGGTWRRDQTGDPDDFPLPLLVDTYTLEGSGPRDGQMLTRIDVKSRLKLSDNNPQKRDSKSGEANGAGIVFINEGTGKVVNAELNYLVKGPSPFKEGETGFAITAKLLASPKE